MKLQERILEELAKCDRCPCELYNALKLRNYRELWQSIEQLKTEEKIESYFRDTPPSATLTYRIKKLKPSIIPWRQNATT